MKYRETGKYKIYFRIWPTQYYMAEDLYLNSLCLIKKVFDEGWGDYRWKEVRKISL